MACRVAWIAALVALTAFPITRGQSVADCEAELPGYDLKKLTDPVSWVIHNQPCTNVTTDTACSYYFAVCKQITRQFPSEACFGAQVCQFNDNTQTAYALGQFSSAQYFDNSHMSDSKTGKFTIEVSQPVPGQDYIKTGLEFVCDETVVWPTSNDTELEVPAAALIGKVHGGYDSMWSLQFRYAGACKSASSSGGLSGGVIFLIVLICLVSSYIIIGCIIGRVRGKTGFDAMPNADLWRSCGSHVKGGCSSLCSCCSSGSPSKGSRYEEL